MEVAVSNRVIARDNFGRFIAECKMAATATVKELIEEGTNLSRAMAPASGKPDPRTAPLKASIYGEMLSATSGHWVATARHALPIEFGAGAHQITGWVGFFWENAGRQWEPGPNMINHPGNAAQPYLRPAYEVIMSRAISVADKHYPG